MQVIINPNPASVAQRATNFIERKIKSNPKTTLGLATGSTPLLLYRNLINLYEEKRISFKEVISFNLDEYIGILETHKQSYHYYMYENLFKHVDIDLAKTHIPKGNHSNPFEAAELFEEEIKQNGGIDLQILGIGRNGHIGFNEPSSSLSSVTRIKTLTQSTIESNKRFFSPGEFQPVQAITMGMQTISQSRMIILLATGEDKAQAIFDAVEGSISASCPASLLQFHRHVVFLIDEAAASKLKNTNYYYHVDKLTEEMDKLYRLSDI